MQNKVFMDEDSPVKVTVDPDGSIAISDGSNSAKFRQQHIPAILRLLTKGTRYLASELDELSSQIQKECPGVLDKPSNGKTTAERFDGLVQESEET